MAMKTTFSITGYVAAVDLFHGGRLRVRIESADGHLVEVWQEVATGTAKVDGVVIDRSEEDVISEVPSVQVGDTATISVSITASGAPAASK